MTLFIGSLRHVILMWNIVVPKEAWYRTMDTPKNYVYVHHTQKLLTAPLAVSNSSKPDENKAAEFVA